MAGERWEAVLIAGPTASGKSALALALARERGGVVINADSMQVYRDLRILTARPSPADEGAAPHRLYGTIDAGDAFSVARYAEAAQAEVRRAWDEARLPILVGGTGLYLRALTEGLSDLPPIPPGVREGARDRATAELRAELVARDPDAAARLEPGDRQRTLRALEVLAATGRSITAFQGRRRPGALAGRRVLKLFLAPERAASRDRIDARFLAMLGAGALDEVRDLAARGLDPALPAMRAHGVPGLLAHLRGELALEAAVARGQADTRAYAKRQATWFRHQAGPGWSWLAPEIAPEAARAALG